MDKWQLLMVCAMFLRMPGKNKFIGCIIHILSFITSFEKHGLDNAVPFERFHSFYNLPDGIMSGRTVKYTDILFIHRIQFKDVVVNLV